jgi:heat shock protein HslJ
MMIRVVALKRVSAEFGIVALVASTLILAPPGCSAAPLAGSEWWPTSIAGAEMPQEGDIFVRFEDKGKLAGNGGCNGFFGAYEVTGNSIEIGPLGATRRACQDPVGLHESRLFEALAKARRFQRDGTELSLFDEAGALLAHLRQADAD